jgi:uncharacterized integral membrane protein
LAWTATVVSLVLGVALVDFIVQNTRSVKVEFFSVSGHIPVSVALLAAALAGAAVVVVVGVSRTTQIRLAARRRWRHKTVAEPEPPSGALPKEYGTEPKEFGAEPKE